MKIFFCEGCGKRLTDADLERGTAVDKQVEGIFCSECAANPAPPPVHAPARRPSGTVVVGQAQTKSARITQSRIQASSGRRPSGVFHAQPPRNATSPAAVYAGVAGGIVILLVVLVFATRGKEPEPRTVRAAEPAPGSRTTAAMERPAPKPAPREAKPAKPAPETPPRDGESEAQRDFDAAAAPKGLAQDDKAGRIAALEGFLKRHGDSIQAARARSMLEQLKHPASKPEPAASQVTLPDGEVINDAQTAFAKGVEWEKKDQDKAVLYYSRAIELNPRIAEFYNNRGNCLWKLYNPEPALADANKAIELNTSLWQPHLHRAIALIALGREQEAGSSIEKALAANNRNPDLERFIKITGTSVGLVARGRKLEDQTLASAADLQARAHARVVAKRHAEAEADAEAALKLDPAHGASTLYALLLHCANERRDTQTRYAVAKRWQAAQPTSPDAHHALAREMLTQPDLTLQDHKQGLELARKAAEMTQNRNPVILDLLAIALFKNGQVREARELLQKVLQALPPAAPPEQRKQFEQHLKEMEAVQ